MIIVSYDNSSLMLRIGISLYNIYVENSNKQIHAMWKIINCDQSDIESIHHDAKFLYKITPL